MTGNLYKNVIAHLMQCHLAQILVSRSVRATAPPEEEGYREERTIDPMPGLWPPLLSLLSIDLQYSPAFCVTGSLPSKIMVDFGVLMFISLVLL